MQKCNVFGFGLLALVFSTAGVACSAAAPEGPDQGESVVQDSDDLKNKTFCGGIAAFPCPEGYNCVDDPTDNCDPQNGGADCGGYCKRRGKPAGKCKDPNRNYVSTDPNQCMLVKFFCAEGTSYFSDNCGCGCETTTTTGETCGANTCAAGEYCCNASCGICAPLDGVCIQIACEPI